MLRPTPLIAIVEDDPTLNKILGLVLAGEGYNTVACYSGAEAREVIWERHPDLVFMDMEMEHSQAGWQVVEQMQKDPRTRSISVIICSGQQWFLHEHQHELHTYGCAVLHKGFQVEPMLTLVREVLGLSPSVLPRG